MEIFEWLLVLLAAALALAAASRRIGAPYPAMLAVGGVALAFIPGAPKIPIDPDLTLAIFIAPALLDAAFDTSVRDIKRDWPALTGLAVGAVIATTAAVAWVARALVPDMPWPVAIALGAIVAPTDAIAATAVLRQMAPPHRVITLLEGEGLFNDATALIIYRAAVGAALTGAFAPSTLVVSFLTGVVGGIVLGAVMAKISMWIMPRVQDLPSQIITQFLGTFAVWILADKLGVSAVLTLVVYAISIARTAPARSPAHYRLPSYAVWEVVVFLLNALAFVLVGIQLRPVVSGFSLARNGPDILFAAAVFATVVAMRFVWVFGFVSLRRMLFPRSAYARAAPGGVMRVGLLIVWSGMRGVITIATALALPADPAVFPHRDLVVLSAFTVVLASLVVQGFTLRPLLAALKVGDDDPVGRETMLARRRAWQAAIDSLDGDASAAAEAVRSEYLAQISANAVEEFAEPMVASEHTRLRRRAVLAARQAALDMRASYEIGDDAFHRIEAELDLIEIGAPE